METSTYHDVQLAIVRIAIASTAIASAAILSTAVASAARACAARRAARARVCPCPCTRRPTAGVARGAARPPDGRSGAAAGRRSSWGPAPGRGRLGAGVGVRVSGIGFGLVFVLRLALGSGSWSGWWSWGLAPCAGRAAIGSPPTTDRSARVRGRRPRAHLLRVRLRVQVKG